MNEITLETVEFIVQLVSLGLMILGLGLIKLKSIINEPVCLYLGLGYLVLAFLLAVSII